ncbi:MAG: hypothetical protein IJS07_04610 [Bacteroidales bacterium]|nr:hypothetical protein [Bacteroidales bacterium]
MKSSFAGILSDLSAAQASKLTAKLPSWAAAGVSVPTTLSLEQCSSEPTALYKARLARSIMAAGTIGGRETRANIALSFSEHGSPLPPESTVADEHVAGSSAAAGSQKTRTMFARGRLLPALWTVADLTGGLGVDSWAFSQVAGRVIYNELSPDLARQASENFRILGCDNITVMNHSAEEALDQIRQSAELKPGPEESDTKEEHARLLIYLDPDRRAATGAKMVRLEDCRPNLIELLPRLLDSAPYILVKLSPMLDITQMLWRLSGCVSGIWILSTHRECRELIVLISRNISTLAATATATVITVAEVHPDGTADELHFEAEARPSGQTAPNRSVTNPAGIPLTAAIPEPGTYIFEPGAALMKSGCFAQLCSRYNLSQLDTSTRLFVCNKQGNQEYSSEPIPELEPFGRFRRVSSIRPLSGKTLKELGKEYPRCEITAKNIPMTTDQVRDRMGSAPGGDVHIYATSILGRRSVVICTASAQQLR